VVPVLNGERTIKECVVSLLGTDYPAELREILVVDNGSTDRTGEIVKSYPVSYLREERRGAARARNKGIEASKGEVLAFTDADCIVSRGWLRVLVQPFAEQNVGGVAGEIVSFPPSTPAERYAARIRHLSPQLYLSRRLLPFAVFANLSFRREVFDGIGLLDGELFQGDSTDFCTRFLRETGFRLAYAPKAMVFHRHRKTAWELFQQQWSYGRGHALLYIKYRKELPWGWGQSIVAYRDLGKAFCAMGSVAVKYRFRGCKSEELHFRYFEFLKKLAERLGFLRETLARGYPYF
jgi:glycosyltransferase involved in cell wall biosynthesis